MLACGCEGGGARTDASRTPCSETAEPHDEDGDAVFDACDNCPVVANATQLDTTEVAVRAFPDGVGDACDPRPGGSGDILDELYTFATAPAGWDGWTIDGDAAHASGDATWTSPRNPFVGGLLVRVEVATFSPLDPAGAITIVLGAETMSSGSTCTLHSDRLDVLDVGGDTSSIMLAPPIAADEPFTLIGWQIVVGTTTRTRRIVCRVVRSDATKETSVMIPDTLALGAHAIALTQANASLGSVSVYTSPGPKNP